MSNHIHDNLKMREMMLKSFLYDRQQKILNSNEFNEKFIREQLKMIDNIKDEFIIEEMERIKEDISYFKQNKEIFLEQEIDKINCIDKTLSDYIDNQKGEMKVKKDKFEGFFRGGKSADFNGVVKLIREYDRYYINILHRYYNYMVEVVYPLGEIIFPKWEDEVTKIPENSGGQVTDLTNSEFLLLVHAVGCNCDTAIKKVKSCNIISTSMITNDKCDTYADRDYGFIYTPTKDNVLLINQGDCYADEIPIIEDYPGLSAEYVSLNSYLNYTPINTHRVCLIKQLKNTMKSEKYNEIVLINNEETRPIGVFVKKDAKDSRQELAKELADKMNLILVKV